MTTEIVTFSDTDFDRLDRQGIFSGYEIRAKLTGAFDDDEPIQSQMPNGLRGPALARAVLTGEVDYRDIPVL